MSKNTSKSLIDYTIQLGRISLQDFGPTYNLSKNTKLWP